MASGHQKSKLKLFLAPLSEDVDITILDMLEDPDSMEAFERIELTEEQRIVHEALSELDDYSHSLPWSAF